METTLDAEGAFVDLAMQEESHSGVMESHICKSSNSSDLIISIIRR